MPRRTFRTDGGRFGAPRKSPDVADVSAHRGRFGAPRTCRRTADVSAHRGKAPTRTFRRTAEKPRRGGRFGAPNQSPPRLVQSVPPSTCPISPPLVLSRLPELRVQCNCRPGGNRPPPPPPLALEPTYLKTLLFPALWRWRRGACQAETPRPFPLAALAMTAQCNYFGVETTGHTPQGARALLLVRDSAARHPSQHLHPPKPPRRTTIAKYPPHPSQALRRPSHPTQRPQSQHAPKPHSNTPTYLPITTHSPPHTTPTHETLGDVVWGKGARETEPATYPPGGLFLGTVSAQLTPWGIVFGNGGLFSNPLGVCFW